MKKTLLISVITLLLVLVSSCAHAEINESKEQQLMNYITQKQTQPATEPAPIERNNTVWYLIGACALVWLVKKKG